MLNVRCLWNDLIIKFSLLLSYVQKTKQEREEKEKEWHEKEENTLINFLKHSDIFFRKYFKMALLPWVCIMSDIFFRKYFKMALLPWVCIMSDIFFRKYFKSALLPWVCIMYDDYTHNHMHIYIKQTIYLI